MDAVPNEIWPETIHQVSLGGPGGQSIRYQDDKKMILRWPETIYQVSLGRPGGPRSKLPRANHSLSRSQWLWWGCPTQGISYIHVIYNVYYVYTLYMIYTLYIQCWLSMIYTVFILLWILIMLTTARFWFEKSDVVRLNRFLPTAMRNQWETNRLIFSC